MTTRKVHIMVEDEVWNQFLEYIREKHGKVKGVLWQELKQAILKHMGKNPTGSYLQNKGLYPSKTLRIVDSIAAAVIEQFKKGKTVTSSWIEEYIKLNISPAPQTIERYMTYFKEIYVWSTWDNKFIKPWTFRRKNGKPLWNSEEEYLEWLYKHGYSATWVKKTEEIEKTEISELLNAEVTD